MLAISFAVFLVAYDLCGNGKDTSVCSVCLSHVSLALYSIYQGGFLMLLRIRSFCFVRFSLFEFFHDSLLCMILVFQWYSTVCQGYYY